MTDQLKIAIVDDEDIQVDTMISLIKEAAARLSLSVSLIDFSSGEAFLFALEDQPDLDMVFLDIEMNQTDGLEVAKKIRQTDKDLTIVFATAFAEYAVQGYDVQALDYLLKPIELDKVKRVLKRHLDRQPAVVEKVTLESQGEVIKLALDDILYVEVNRRECEIHTLNGPVTVSRTLKEMSEELSDDFIQTHRSYLVNVSHMNRLLKTDIELSNGTVVPVSRRLVKQVQEQFVMHNKGAVFYDD